MLIGSIRPVESTTVDVEGYTLDEIHTKLAAATPAGFELTDAPVRMTSGTTLLTATGVYARRDGAREIEADTQAGLEAKVPEGWQLVAVRLSAVPSDRRL